MGIMYYNQEFLTSEQVTIPCDDRSFRYGDGLFETIPFYHRQPFRPELYLRRLQHGLDALKIDYNTDGLAAICHELIRQNTLESGFIRIQLSRGSGGRGYLPEKHIKPHLLAEILPPATTPESAALTVSSHRLPSQALQPFSPYKTAQKLTHTLSKMEANEHGYYDAILTNERDEITEVSSGNLFWIKSGTLFTPSLATGALAGITRAVLMELSPLPVSEIAAPLNLLQQAEEIFICNSAWGVLPVIEIAGMGALTTGPVTQQLQTLYQREVEQLCAG